MPTKLIVPKIQPPRIGSRWLHTNGSYYIVLMLTNVDSTRLEEYPVTVVYQREHDLSLWSKPLLTWATSRTEVAQKY